MISSSRVFRDTRLGSSCAIVAMTGISLSMLSCQDRENQDARASNGSGESSAATERVARSAARREMLAATRDFRQTLTNIDYRRLGEAGVYAIQDRAHAKLVRRMKDIAKTSPGASDDVVLLLGAYGAGDLDMDWATFDSRLAAIAAGPDPEAAAMAQLWNPHMTLVRHDLPPEAAADRLVSELRTMLANADTMPTLPAESMLFDAYGLYVEGYFVRDPRARLTIALSRAIRAKPGHLVDREAESLLRSLLDHPEQWVATYARTDADSIRGLREMDERMLRRRESRRAAEPPPPR
jgi:hypothetical protein